jgi:hypothetical protein
MMQDLLICSEQSSYKYCDQGHHLSKASLRSCFRLSENNLGKSIDAIELASNG